MLISSESVCRSSCRQPPLSRSRQAPTFALPATTLRVIVWVSDTALSSCRAKRRLRDDLQSLIRAYRALTISRGVDADTDADTEVSDFNVPDNVTITEKRKYALHKKI